MADRRVVLAAVAGGLVGWLACRLSQRGARRRARKSGRVFVGIDLGGTTISAALCDEHGAVGHAMWDSNHKLRGLRTLPIH